MNKLYLLIINLILLSFQMTHTSPSFNTTDCVNLCYGGNGKQYVTRGINAFTAKGMCKWAIRERGCKSCACIHRNDDISG